MTGGAPFAGVSTYVSNLRYGAAGNVRHIDFGNTRALDITYDGRLRTETYVIPGLMSKRYEYNGDGMIRYVQDQLASNSLFDRSYSYDHMSRIAEALSGPAARGEADMDNRLYKLNFVYD